MPEIYFKPRPESVKPSCVVVTYSVTNNTEDAIKTLRQNGTSVHYIIEKNGSLKQLSLSHGNEILEYIDDSPEQQRPLEEVQTFYAGKSSWRGKESVNGYGIGIMYINDAKSDITSEQIKTTLELLNRIRIKNYPEMDFQRNLVSLGEVAAKHIALKNLLNYQELATCGFGQFIETTQEQRDNILITEDTSAEKISELQKNLKAWGYDIEVNGKWKWEDNDPEAKDPNKKYKSTEFWVSKFNSRYVPDAEPDQAVVIKPAANWTEADAIVLSRILEKNLAKKEILTSNFFAALSNNDNTSSSNQETSSFTKSLSK
ncbi:MAG: hypothetical protein REH83_03770 [Rickettsiella sp.]|nr:hypothetical protein [Rickettsiella sp.]